MGKKFGAKFDGLREVRGNSDTFGRGIGPVGAKCTFEWINDDKFIHEELTIQRVALMPHHGIDADINITAAPKNQDPQERTFGPTFPECFWIRCVD